MRFAPWGTKELLLSILLYGASLLVLTYGAVQYSPALAWAMVLPAFLLGVTIYFFRDPERVVPQEDGLLVSPADGKITSIEEVDEPSFIGGKALRISIFLSVFNVHLNRTPCAGTVRYQAYKKGEFLNAMNTDSGHRNEANDIGLETDDPRVPRVLVRQIAGLIARRIICDVDEGQTLARGERVGMIKFSSRTDLFVPADTKLALRIQVGDAVQAGSTILGELS